MGFLENVVGQNIKNLRKTHKLTQGQLAELVGVDITTVSKWELGRYLPTEENRQQLAELFKVAESALLAMPKKVKIPADQLTPELIEAIKEATRDAIKSEISLGPSQKFEHSSVDNLKDREYLLSLIHKLPSDAIEDITRVIERVLWRLDQAEGRSATVSGE